MLFIGKLEFHGKTSIEMKFYPKNQSDSETYSIQKPTQKPIQFKY